MLKSLVFLLRFVLFWLAFFLIDRLLFLLYFPAKTHGAAFSELSRSFLYGLWMDLSMTGYICALPLLVFLALWIFPKLHLSTKWIKGYMTGIVVVFGIITIANFNIYREWGAKINFKALDFLFTTPEEAFASSASSPIFGSFMIFFAFAGVCYLLAKALVRYRIPAHPPKAACIGAGVVLIVLNFLAIRGGWQLSPMNESMAYFSERPFLNHAAINTEWSLIHDILKNKYSNKNPYEYFPEKTVKATVRDLLKPATGDPINILNTRRPNIVIVIMESFTADIFEELGGEKGITPNLKRLTDDGVLFTNTYACGDRTDKGIIAVLSGFPSQAVRSIISFNSKQERLPGMMREFASNGYHTSFYYGGETEFFNVKSYMLSHGCQRLIEKKDFKSNEMNSKWGAYDHPVFEKQLADLNKEPQPFFSSLLTLTNHEPFELPGAYKFGSDDIPHKFRSTAYYADSCIGDYIAKAKKQAWFKNTLFVFVADHGHHLPKDAYDINDPHRFHIPLLFYGGAIDSAYRGKRIETIASQADIATTVLNMSSLSSAKFPWSKDLLNPRTKPFAFYDWDNGFGFATPEQTISFDNIGRQITYRKNPGVTVKDSELSRLGKACMQEVFRQYLEY